MARLGCCGVPEGRRASCSCQAAAAPHVQTRRPSIAHDVAAHRAGARIQRVDRRVSTSRRGFFFLRQLARHHDAEQARLPRGSEPAPRQQPAAQAERGEAGGEQPRAGAQPPVLIADSRPDAVVDQFRDLVPALGRLRGNRGEERDLNALSLASAPRQRWAVPVIAAGTIGAPVSSASLPAP